MKRGILAVAIWFLVMATPAVAAQKPKGGPKPQPVTKSAKTTTITKSSVKPQAGPKTKTSLKGNTKVKTAPAVTTKASKPAKTTKASKTTTATSTTATSTTATSNTATSNTETSTSGSTQTSTVTLSPVQQKLQKNTNLAAKMQSRLPAGTDLMRAASGFKSLGQFVSTVNASHNHDLPFPALKRRIVTEGMSLGQAMKDLR